MTSFEEESLVRRFGAGSGDALAALFEHVGPALESRARTQFPTAMLRKVSVADLLQEVRIVAFRRRADFEYRGPGSFRAWASGILDRRIRKALEQYGGTAKRAPACEVTQGGRPGTADPAERGPSPSGAAIAAEDARRVRDVLASLPSDYRQVLEFARLQQRPLRDVARLMDRSYEATKKLYGRALLRFTDAYGGDEGGGA